MRKEELKLLFGHTSDSKENEKVKVDQMKEQSVFPYLSWNDLLCFRRVCKDAKKLADQFIKENGGKQCPEITIYESGDNKEKTLTHFLQLEFTTPRIYLMNLSGSCMFERESKSLMQLVQKLGTKITHVRVSKLSSFPAGMEKKFYEGLTNLECLVVNEVGAAALSEEQRTQVERILGDRSFPKTFKKLKKMTIGIPPGIIGVDLCFWSRSIMDFCENLEYCGDAFCSNIKLPGMTEEHWKYTLSMIFELIIRSIEERKEKFPDIPNLKYYDFAGYYEDEKIQNKCVVWLNAPKFLKLVDICQQNSVKLLNVNAAWLQDGSYAQHEYLFPPKDQSGPVVSMVNLHAAVMALDMPNLEKLSIPATSKSCLLPVLPVIVGNIRRPWPKLKVLDVTVDSEMLYTAALKCSSEDGTGTLCAAAVSTEFLMEFLFVEIRRPALSEVSLKFVENVFLAEATVNIVSHFGSCCPNLKKLSLINWPGSSEVLAKAFSQLRHLEEIFLKKCTQVGDSAFTESVNSDDGSLINLKKLSKLSLKVLDKMPSITDALFKNVLSHMKLTHLFLSSKRPLSKITSEGVRSLQAGEFASTIEKFPFTGWSLAKESKQNFLKLGEGFRSSQML